MRRKSQAGDDSGHLIQQTRSKLNTYSFDPAEHLESHISKIPAEAVDQEKKLDALFEKLTMQFTEMSREIEEDVSILQDSAMHAERMLMGELQSNSDKLVEVGGAVDGVKLSFDLASEGAVRIGGKLSSAERERSNIDKSIELLGYIREFQDTTAEEYAKWIKRSTTAKEIRGILPDGLQKQTWGVIARELHDLKRILSDMISDDVKDAQQNINRITDRVEMELLGEFDKVIIKLMLENEDDRLVEKARELAEWLHLFNNGQAMQKRYLFTVVQHRIPNDIFFQGSNEQANAVLSQKHYVEEFSDDESDGFDDSHSTIGFSRDDGAEEEEGYDHNNPRNGGKTRPSGGNGHLKSKSSSNWSMELSLMDQLSGLFQMIDTVCQEQFELIRKVFPPFAVPKVTRMLIQRIFNDPAFGIQARVDGILSPQPPASPLSLPEYLDALVIVREKLSALYLLLLECCSHPSMRGMGSESATMRQYTKQQQQSGVVGAGGEGQNSSEYGAAEGGSNSNGPRGSFITRQISGGHAFIDADEEAEEILHSDAEIREFFDDQIAQVFATYRQDYFEKEGKHVRNQYTDALVKSLGADATTAVSKSQNPGLLSMIPLLRYDKIKSVANLIDTVANKIFLNKVFSITTDTVVRMESIGRDDKLLPTRLKELFLLQMGFLSEGIFLPWGKGCVMLLLKHLSARGSSASLPPIEYLAVLSVLTYGVTRVTTHFDEVFQRPLSVVPNIIAICKENRLRTFRNLDIAAREVIYAWTLCIVSHLEKLLMNLQSRYDYAPRLDNSGSHQSPLTFQSPSTACDTVCKELSTVVAAVNSYESSKLVGLDMVKLFWRPLGQQIVGALITHVRKQKISPEGAIQLRRDMIQYSKSLSFPKAPDIVDMMACMKDLCLLLLIPADRLVKLIVEDMRYLDISVILAMVRARTDFQLRDPQSYAHVLSQQFTSHRWDDSQELPWETQKPTTTMTAATMAEAGIMGSKWTARLGPNTLRRSTGVDGQGSVTALFLNEIALLNRSNNGKATGIDLSQYMEENGEALEGNSAFGAAAVGGIDVPGGGSGGTSSSSFAPSRPGSQQQGNVHVSLSGSQQQRLSGLSSSRSSIARPDLMINSGGSGHPSGGGGGGGEKGNGTAGGVGVRPGHTQVARGSAATLLSVGANQQRERLLQHQLQQREQEQELYEQQQLEELQKQQEQQEELAKERKAQQVKAQAEFNRIVAMSHTTEDKNIPSAATAAKNQPKKLMKKISSFFGGR